MALLGAAASSAAAAEQPRDTERWSGRAEVGVEHDSNVHRAERLPDGSSAPAPATGPDAIVGSFLTRGVLGWSAADRLSARHDVAFSVLGATKLFWSEAARPENVAVVETSGSWGIRLGRRNRLRLSLPFYEVIQMVTPTERALGYGRDFRSATPSLRWTSVIGERGTLTVLGGYRHFVYKPSHSHDFGAPLIGLEGQWAFESEDGNNDWDLGAGVSAELRRFTGARFVPEPPNCAPRTCAPAPDPAGVRHQDQFLSGHLHLTWTGAVLVGAAYVAQWNRSNSYAEGLMRHIALVRFAAALPLGLYVAARGEMVIARYADPVSLAIGPTGISSVTVEEENRSQVRIELSRGLIGGFDLVARGSYYANPFGDRVAPYERLTATLSLTYSAE